MQIARHLAAACLALALPGLALADGRSNPEVASATWADLREQLWPGREIGDGAGIVSVDAPYRAHDAALVPVAVEVDPGPGRRVGKLVLIVDENPAPVAAEFEIGEALGTVVALSTRLRVNAYSNVRAVAELDDGTLWQSARFVKASGGCAAPATKDAEAAMAALGRVKVKGYQTDEGAREAQVMIRHPNNSGFQMDQVTQLYIPAFFVDGIEVSEGERLLFRMSGGISLSEDPTIRFRYRADGPQSLAVRVTDTGGGEYRGAFAPESGS